MQIDEAGGSVDLIDPRRHLIRHHKVDLEYMAFWNVPGHDAPHELRQSGLTPGAQEGIIDNITDQ